MESFVAMNNESKIKLLNLENSGLNKRVNSLKSEVGMLREELKILRLDNLNTKEPETPKKSSKNQIDEIEMKKIEADFRHLRSENENLRTLLKNIKETNNSANIDRVVKSLKEELSSIKKVNEKLQKEREENSKI